MSARNWIAVVLVAWLTLLGVILGINYHVDPQRLNQTPTPGADRRQARESIRLLQMATMTRVHPRVAFFGSSRVQAGMDIDHPGLGARDAIYNFAIPGATMEEIGAVAERALRDPQLEEVWIGLDFFAFNAYKRPSNETADALRYFDLPLLRPAFFLGYRMFEDSIDLLRGAAPKAKYVLRERGEADIRDWGKMPLRDVFLDGVRGLPDGLCPAPLRTYALTAGATRPGFEALARVLTAAYARKAKVVLFINPEHWLFGEAARQMGLAPIVDTWKRDLVALLADLERKHHPERPAVLWDFSAPNAVTLEPLPAPGVTTMTHYWDPGHFRTEVGAAMISRMLGQAGVPQGFGELLTTAGIDATLVQQAVARAAYPREHPEEAAAVKAALAKNPAQCRSSAADRISAK